MEKKKYVKFYSELLIRKKKELRIGSLDWTGLRGKKKSFFFLILFRKISKFSPDVS